MRLPDPPDGGAPGPPDPPDGGGAPGPPDPRPAGAAIRLRGVSHTYASGAVPVLHDLDLDVEAGASLALMGPSGAGKSTLLSLIGGLEPVQAGSILVDDEDLSARSRDDLAAYRRATVGFVFQHYGLVEVLTASENVALALSLAGVPRAGRIDRARELLSAVDLAARADHLPAQLSGGERQRVAIARALANRPRLLLADEPTGNLDGETAGQVLDLLTSVHHETGCTSIVVTHDASVAARAARVLELRSGRWEAA
jgi:putative ABC transport system ATP-binding protein